MPVHFVGETIDKRRAHAQAQAGRLVQLLRGVYVDAADDIDAIVLGHAVRIAHYLYQGAYLSSASAVLLAPTSDGRLFISGRRNQRTRLRSLEIIQNQAPAQPSTTPVIVGDDLGEIRLMASSPRQRFLEAFRLRSEHASAITEPMRAQMAERLINEYGAPGAAADAIWVLARELDWIREGQSAERYLTAKPTAATAPRNKAALDLLVAWHGVSLGRLTHDGFEWRWAPSKKAMPPLIREVTPGKLPPFIESLLPEGWLEQVLKQRDQREVLKQGRRYLSNIAIVATTADLKALPLDVLEAELRGFTEGGRFTGQYAGPARDQLEATFLENLAQLFARAETPRLSGAQIKAPMCLKADGTLLPAVTAPFTHILKPAGTAGFEAVPAVEWLCLELGRAVGLQVPDVALVEMPDSMPPALVVERFDIRRTVDDRRLFAMEDFCSALDLPTAAKYDGMIERVARGLRPLSTDPVSDIEILFRRAVFAWLIADGDMHLKNLALLKVAEPASRKFASVRFAPLYDAVTTRVFPGLAGDRMALKLNGKDDRLTRQDFMMLARTIDLPIARAEAILSETVDQLQAAALRMSLPAGLGSDSALRAAEQMRGIIAVRSEALV
jgi:serine/threonine-protein kinase HipA